jgi:hypothetical protein
VDTLHEAVIWSDALEVTTWEMRRDSFTGITDGTDVAREAYPGPWRPGHEDDRADAVLAEHGWTRTGPWHTDPSDGSRLATVTLRERGGG